jgi:hypothetical protein
MKQPEPKCPYCGTEMKTFTRTIYNTILAHGYAMCPECRSTSPRVVPEDIWDIEGDELTEAVKEAAMRRPLQKPLTLEELHALIDPGDEVVTYCEGISFCQTYATIWIDGQVIDALGLHPKGNISFYSYGKTWRAWAARPTDEERAAAPWEE